MKNLFRLIIATVLFSHIGMASESEVLWVKLEKIFTYKDIDRFCSTKEMPTPLLFGAELIDGEVKAATFKTNIFEPLSEKLAFTTNELKQIVVGKDKSDRMWIESIKLNARQLNWIFTRGGGMDGCIPTQPLATLSPNDFNYKFNLGEILIDPQITSNLGKFSGKRKDGRLYQITLSLTQKHLKF